MNKLGLRPFFLLTSGVFALILASVCVALWLASQRLVDTAEIMENALDGIVASETILENLDVHRRQALLHPVTSSDERHKVREQAVQKIRQNVKDLDVVLMDGPLRENVNRRIEAYLKDFDVQTAAGYRGPDLYMQTAHEYEDALHALEAINHHNQKQALKWEKQAAAQSHFFKQLAFGLAVVMVLVGSIIFWLALRLLYQPLVGLSRAIKQFSAKRVLPETPRSLTEIENIGNALRTLAETLNRQNEQRLIFLSAIAHDLKNPLGAIQMSAELLSSDGGSVERREELGRIVGRQTNQMRRLVDDLLDATRIEAGHLQLRLNPNDLGVLLSDCVTLFQTTSVRHHFRLDLTEEKIQLGCDATRLSQVFNNLLSNALKYSPEGGEIVVSLRREGHNAVISVRDEGVGIDPRDLEGIFEPFRRSSFSSHQIPGVGLGLSTSRKIVEAHGGHISAKNAAGTRGAVFEIRLPL